MCARASRPSRSWPRGSQLADRAAAELVWRRRQFVVDQLERFGLLIAWAALIVVFGTVRPEAFLSWANFATILGSQAVLVVATLEMLEEAVKIGFRPPEDLGFHLDTIRAAHSQSLLRLGGAIVSFYARDEFPPTQVERFTIATPPPHQPRCGNTSPARS
jgi:hypothetical protein